MRGSELPSGVIEILGPPCRRVFVYHTGAVGAEKPAARRGWQIVIEQMDDTGQWQSFRDGWEEHFSDLAQYLMTWAPWRNADNDEPLDMGKVGYGPGS